MHTRNLAALEMHLIGLLRPGLRRIHGEHGRDVYDLDGSNTRYQRLRRALAPFLHRFITVSADLRDWLVNDVGIAAKQVIQIYNGVDQQAFKPCEAGRPELAPVGFGGSDQRLIGTVGRLAEVKDQATLLKATRLLLEQRPTLRTRVRVVIVGDGPLRAALQRQVEESGLADVVWLTGDRDDVPALLQMMDVFVLPSLAEGISNTVLEAMASGLPIVATDTGGNPELVEPAVNGYLFPVGDAQALAAMLGKLIDDDALVRAMGAAARTRVEQRFDWQRTVEQYLGVYDEALGLPSRQ
jgi:sugar transferase (PEP-CTERM/EpsH1 system associated)